MAILQALHLAHRRAAAMGHQTTSKSPLIQGFRVSEPIGGGAFSKVYRAQHTVSGELVAVKVIPYAGGALDQRLLKEVKVHSALKNANVLEVVGSEVDQDGSRREWGIGPAFFILLEYAAGGDLFDKIAPDYGVSEDLAHFFFYQLLSGLNYIHLQGVAHRDLKPENLLLDGMGNLKISDFGLCSVFRLRDKERKLNDACGSPPYAAPELAYRQPYAAEPVDVWSAGIVLFTLLVGNTPWDQPTNNSPEFQAYLSGDLLRQDPWTRLSSASLSLLKKILNVDPAKRLTIRQITQHRWFVRPSYYLNAEGQCRNAARLANDLLTGLKEHGYIEQAAEQAANFGMEEDDDDAMDVDSNTFQASQSQAPRSQRSGTSNQEPLKTAMTGYSQASKAAPSQRGNTAFNFVISLHSLKTIQQNIQQAIDRLNAKSDFNIQTQLQPLQPGDIDQRDPVPGGDGFILAFGAYDRNKQKLSGWIKVMPEFDSPLLEELAERSGIQADKAYIIKFDRGKGDNLSFRLLHKGIVDQCPPQLFVAR